MPGRSNGEDAPLSQNAFVEQANEICRASRAEARTIEAPSLADPIAVEQSIRESAVIQRRALRDLRELEPPETDAPGVENWLRLVAETIDEMHALADAVATGNRAAIGEASERGDALTDDAEAFTEAYGLHDCSTAEAPEGEDDPGTDPSTTTTTTPG